MSTVTFHEDLSHSINNNVHYLSINVGDPSPSPPPQQQMSQNLSIPEIVKRARTYFGTHATKSYEWRYGQLQAMHRMLSENEKVIEEALFKDLGKPQFEASFTEIVVTMTEIESIMSHVKEWMKPTPVATPLALLPAESFIASDPRGVILNISPFNYPIQLSISPIVAAIAAGNCCVLKPSELTPNCSAILKKLFESYLDNQAIYVVEGAVEETTELLKQVWDYIFFTGSEFVGKIVAKAAAENLTPVTLELGGKSPTIIDQDADLASACRRIVWGKWMNCGQTCIAPDYVYVHNNIRQKFLTQFKATIDQFYRKTGDGKAIESIDKSPNYGRIVNTRHAARLNAIIDAHKDDIIYGGEVNIEQRFISPTVLDLTNLSVEQALKTKVMEGEIFGPILPLLAFSDLNTVIDHINARPKPLALYYFGVTSSAQDRVLRLTSSGGVTINDTLMHIANHELPFGGVGTAGYGSYHGKFGFDLFSHKKAVLNKSIHMDSPQRYPPYTVSNAKVFRFAASIHRVNSHTFKTLGKVVLVPMVLAAVLYGLYRAGLRVSWTDAH